MPMQICKVCFKDIKKPSFRYFFDKNQTICDSCLNKFVPSLNAFKVDDIKGYYLYPYDDIVRSFLYQIKGSYDIELAPIFINHYAKILTLKYLGYTKVFIPSFIEDDQKRGFNHVEEIFKDLRLKSMKLLEKKDHYKQSDQSFSNRGNIHKHLRYIGPSSLKGLSILVVDDVFTTGSTMKAVLNLLKNKGAKKIQFLVIAKVINNVHSF